MFLFYLEQHDHPAASSRWINCINWINQIDPEKPGYSRAPAAYARKGDREICRDPDRT
jgi:hypothetical protein